MVHTAKSKPMDKIGQNKHLQLVWAGGHNLLTEWRPPSTSDRASLVFLHEGLGSISQWKDLPHSLGKKTGCGVLVYDRFGYGGSACLAAPHQRPNDFMQREASTTVPDLLNTFGIKHAILYGHSDGGTIALLAAAEGDTRILGVVSESAHLFVEPDSIDSIRSIRSQWETTDLRERLRRHHGDNVDGAFLGWSNLWLNPDFASFDIRGKLKNITCPVLAIQGTDDVYGTLAQVDAIKKSVSGDVETLILPDCGHSPHVEARTVVMDHVSEFLLTNLRH